MNLSNQCVR